MDVTEQPEPEPDESGDPGANSVQQFLLYSLSLPERAVRGGAGVLGGAIKHSAGLLLPQAFRDSKTYTTLVRFTLDFMIQDLAGVKDPHAPAPPADAPPVDQFIARKTVGSFLDLASMATLHVSPLVVLAVLSDVAYGSQTYLKELSQELKARGVIDEKSTIDSASQLLDAVAQVSGLTSGSFDAPPLSVEGLRDTINQTREAAARLDVRKVIPQAELERMWIEMYDIAEQEQLNVLAVSGAIALNTLEKIGQLGQGALSSVRVAGNLVDQHILEHYRTSVGEIRTRGFYTTLSETSAPYIAAVWENFSSARDTWTEQLFSGRLWGKAKGALGSWFQRPKPE